MEIEFFKHNIGQDDIKRATDVLNSIFLTTGQVVLEFENSFASYLKAQHAIGVTSCTAALHLSLLAYGIGKGDEVVTSPMSFCATSNSILHAGATPVFVDVEKGTGNINAELIEAAITKRTKAIMPVHLYGQMCDMKKIRTIADKYNLIIIEDAAHAIEAERDGVRVGEMAETACFSFYATKNITSGEGGAITIGSSEKADIIRMLRLHGIDKSAIDRYTKVYQHWDMPVLGWKYNMDNIHAALLIGQLKKIDGLWKRRDEIWRIYEGELAGIEDLRILKTIENSRHARHLFTILVQESKRDSILHELQDRGIGVAVNYRPIHLLKYYRETFGYKEGDFPIAEDIGERTVSIPLYPRLDNTGVCYVIESLKKVLKN